MKVGTVLYECSVADKTGKVSWDEWHIRTIRGGKIYAILKTSFTWGKLSKHHGDFGWLDPIPSWCRRSCEIGKPWPKWYCMATTKREAIKLAIASMRNAEDDDYEGVTVADIIRKLNTMLTRIK